MGAFDDLIPAKSKPTVAAKAPAKAAPKRGGLFDDLIPAPKPKRSIVDDISGFAANLNRGLVVGDEVKAALSVGEGLMTGRHRFGLDKPGNPVANNAAMLRDAFKTELAGQRRTEDEYTAEHPYFAALGRGTGMAATVAIPTGAVMTSGNALMAGARGATTSAMTGYASGLGDRGNLDERVRKANVGAAVAAPLGFVAGSAAHMMTNRPSVDERAVRELARRTGVTADDLNANAQGYRDAGIADPALVDVVDESGRGLLGAAASRPTPGRQAVREFVETRANSLPERMSQQSRRIMSPDPRTPDQIAQELGQARRVAGDAQFGAVRGERLPLSEDAVMALRTADGRGAIRSAAAASARSLRPEDRAIAAELNRLADDVLDRPGEVQVSVGMAQSISESLLDAADAAARAGRNREAGSLGDLGRAIRDNARQTVPGYDEALTNYAAQSRMIEAAGQGEDFLRRNTDEFVAGVQAMGPDEIALARATGRRAVERASGENISAAPGVARRIATTPEQQARNAALLGPEDAQSLQGAMAAEARMVDNARDISPRSGSPTQPRTQDAARLAEGARDVVTVATGGWGGAIGVVINRLKTAGMSDRSAQALVEIAIDPARLQEAIGYLTPRVGRQQAVNIIRELRAIGVGSAPPRGQPVEQSAQGLSDRRVSMTGGSR